VQIHGVEVKGQGLDVQTRCAHYALPQDVIAIKFACCQTYYPCYQCHEALADHPHTVWPAHQFEEPAVLCGVCGAELTIAEYLQSHSTCPRCQAAFNPGCATHYSLYFDMSPP
jgi:uncharacterized CHY-type Zn-finger protein